MGLKYERLAVELNIGKNSLVRIHDDSYQTDIDLYASDGEQPIGQIILNREGYEYVRGGGKLETKSVSQFKKEIK